MMQDPKTYPDVIDKILILLKNTFGDTFKSYYEGDPVSIPKVSLPCIIVEKINTRISVGATGTDNLDEEMNIRVVMNQSDDVGASDDVDMTERKLRKIVEARDPATNYFMPNTLMYALRTNLTLGSAVINNTVDINYDMNPRPDMMVTSEATVSIITTERIIVPNRV
jgi:hypothetical protein